MNGQAGFYYWDSKSNTKRHETTRKQALPSHVYIGLVSMDFWAVKYLARRRSYAGANWVDADGFFPWFAIREASRYIQLFSFPPGNMVIQAENVVFWDISGQKQTPQKKWGAERAHPQPAPMASSRVVQGALLGHSCIQSAARSDFQGQHFEEFMELTVRLASL